MDSPLSPVFYIGTIHVGQIEGASCLNMGNNWPTNFTSHKKHNQGFGNVSGNQNRLERARSLLHDPDTLDAINVRDDELPEWLESLAQNLKESHTEEMGQEPPPDSPEEDQRPEDPAAENQAPPENPVTE